MTANPDGRMASMDPTRSNPALVHDNPESRKTVLHESRRRAQECRHVLSAFEAYRLNRAYRPGTGSAGDCRCQRDDIQPWTICGPVSVDEHAAATGVMSIWGLTPARRTSATVGFMRCCAGKRAEAECWMRCVGGIPSLKKRAKIDGADYVLMHKRGELIPKY